ncbi:MAG: hypothetical protein JW928_02795, partial [Candidatus Aureabacteria bacterium]|nr:hypothetical protein [Candidatus Auribacterota bacterium]
ESLPEDSEKVKEHLLALTGLILLKKEYIRSDDVPLISRAWLYTENGDDEKKLLQLIKKIIIRKVNVDEASEEARSFDFLSDADKASESFRAYLSKTEDYQRLYKEWKKGKKPGEESKPPDPLDIFSGKIAIFFSLDLFYGSKSVSVILSSKEKPFLTNGEWDQEKGSVSLNISSPSKSRLPEAFYAFWSVPDGKFQKEHFGGIVLEKQDLWEYSFWESGLEERDKKEWRDFVGLLTSGKDLKNELEAFHFTSSAVGETDEKREDKLPDTPRNLILKNLKKEEK